LGLRVESLEEQLKKKRPASGTAAPAAEKKPPPARSAWPSSEEELLQLAMLEPSVVRGIELTAADFSEERHKRIFIRIQEQMTATGKISLPALADDLTEADREWLMRLSLEEREFSEPLEYREQLVRNIKLKKEKQRLQELSRQMATGQASAEAMNEYKDLLRRIKGTSNDAKGVMTK
jgi:hypothetical protein